MSAIQKCLSIITIETKSNDYASFIAARRAIDEFITLCENEDERCTLLRLQTSYDKIALDNLVADLIKGEIADRIEVLTRSLRTSAPHWRDR